MWEIMLSVIWIYYKNAHILNAPPASIDLAHFIYATVISKVNKVN